MILVVGGAGYIGSHTVKQLVRKGYDVIVLDNLSTGHAESVDNKALFIKGDLGDKALLDQVFTEYRIDAVMHFAAFSLVAESVEDPLKYYENNVASTIALLGSMIKHNVKNFIFSSTAATYGIPKENTQIDEEVSANPINPYGRSKLMMEWIIKEFSEAYGISYMILRYFNAAGAIEDGEIGEDHNPETHLIPIVLQHLLGQRESISIYGTDYETKDGTCIRDYIHVEDIADAHILTLKNLLVNNKFKNSIYNLGNGQGYSVKEIIRMCERITGITAKVRVSPRRNGDPASLVASSDKIKNELGWQPKYGLEGIIASAWKWHSKNASGNMT